MDWQKLISDLVSVGMTQAEIGKSVNLSQPTISDIASGRIQDVRWNSGERLRALHKRRMRSAKAAA
jgi:predicted XRE-type DNA-binding protein